MNQTTFKFLLTLLTVAIVGVVQVHAVPADWASQTTCFPSDGACYNGTPPCPNGFELVTNDNCNRCCSRSV